MNKKVFVSFKYFYLTVLSLSLIIFGCESNDNPLNHGTNNLKAANNVFVILFTNTSCINCPPPGGFLDRVDSLTGVTINDTNVVIVRVHSNLFANDPFYNYNKNDNDVMVNYYQGGDINPLGFMNGQYLPTYNQNVWTDSLNSALSKKSSFAIQDTNVFDTTSKTGIWNLTIGQLSGTAVGDLKMYVVITEGHLYYTATNGERWFENIFRGFVTPSTGIDISLSPGQSVNLIENYSIPAGVIAANSQIIVYLQSVSTAKVYAVDKKTIVQ